MNDRIKQLAEQAGSTHKQNLGVYQFYSSELDQFAELIVKECVESIEKTIDTNCDCDSEKMGCEFAITNLKERFGINTKSAL